MDKKKPTRQERAVEIGVTLPTLASWVKCGVDIYDDDQVRQRIRRMRNMPPNLKPEFHPKTDGLEDIIDPDNPENIDIEAIIRNLAQVTDKHEAQTQKLKIDGLINAWKLREAAGKYVSRAVVNEAMIRVGAIFKASLKRFEADLPPMLDGLSPEAMQSLIGEKVDELLRDLESEYMKVNDAEPAD